MTIGVFFIWGVLGGGDAAFWREKEETDEMTGGKKWTVWSPTSEGAPVWIKCRFLKKLWNQPACASHHHRPPAHTHTRTHNHARFSGFELRRMLSVTFQKCERRRGTVHLSETLVFSLYGETYPAEHITISACDNIGNSMYPLYLSVWVSHGHKDGDNVAKWCLRVADLKPSAATYSLTTTLSITSH